MKEFLFYSYDPEEKTMILIDDYLIQEFKRGFKMRLNDSLVLLFPDEKNFEVFEPLVEIFNDEVTLMRKPIELIHLV